MWISNQEHKIQLDHILFTTYSRVLYINFIIIGSHDTNLLYFLHSIGVKQYYIYIIYFAENNRYIIISDDKLRYHCEKVNVHKSIKKKIY